MNTPIQVGSMVLGSTANELPVGSRVLDQRNQLLEHVDKAGGGWEYLPNRTGWINGFQDHKLYHIVRIGLTDPHEFDEGEDMGDSDAALDGLDGAVTRLESWMKRTTSLTQEEAHDVAGVLFVARTWLQIVGRNGETA